MTIKRIIDGRVYEFELTENELYAASDEAERKNMKQLVEAELKCRKDLGIIRADIYDRLAPIVDNIADEVISDIFDSDAVDEICWDIIKSHINDHASRVLK